MAEPGPQGPDLGRRLALFGAVAIVVGIGFLLLGIFYLLLPWVAPLVLGERSTDLGAALMGFQLFVMLGVLMIWVGNGSLRMRRWVRPIMLFISGTWGIVGVFWTLLVLSLIDDLPYLAGADRLQTMPLAGTLVQLFLVGISVGGGLLLPFAFFWAYRDPRVLAACERHDPRPTWSDRCPTPVLALSAALVAAAVFSLPMLIRPIVPLFGTLVTGWPGGGTALVAVTALCLWLALSTYRLQPAGWWSTLLFLILLGVSTLWTFLRVEPLEVYRRMGYPELQLESLERSGIVGRGVTLTGTIGLTLVGIAYMLMIRKYFASPEPHRD